MLKVKQFRVYASLTFLCFLMTTILLQAQNKKPSIQDARAEAIEKAKMARALKKQGLTIGFQHENAGKQSNEPARAEDLRVTTEARISKEPKTHLEKEASYLANLKTRSEAEKSRHKKALAIISNGEVREKAKETPVAGNPSEIQVEIAHQKIQIEESWISELQCKIMEDKLNNQDEKREKLEELNKAIAKGEARLQEIQEEIAASEPGKQDAPKIKNIPGPTTTGDDHSPATDSMQTVSPPDVEAFIKSKKIKKDYVPLMLESYNFSMDKYKGKVVVMNYWFTECKMCLKEIPDLNELVEKYSHENIVFLGMTTDMPEKAMKTTKDYKFKYKIVPMAKPIAEKMWVMMYPTHIVFDENGDRIATLTGNSKEILGKLDNAIQSGLK